MSYIDILYDKSNDMATVTLNRPQVLNAFRTQTILEMSNALQEASNDGSVGIVVIRGAGECAREIILICQRYSASDVKRFGWCSKVAPDDQFETQPQAWIDRILELSPQACAHPKCRSTMPPTHCMAPSTTPSTC